MRPTLWLCKEEGYLTLEAKSNIRMRIVLVKKGVINAHD